MQAAVTGKNFLEEGFALVRRCHITRWRFTRKLACNSGVLQSVRVRANDSYFEHELNPGWIVLRMRIFCWLEILSFLVSVCISINQSTNQSSNLLKAKGPVACSAKAYISTTIIRFRVSCSRCEMYSGHSRLCVCLSVLGRMPTLRHGPGCNLG